MTLAAAILIASACMPTEEHIPAELLTVAESSDYTATSTSDDVAALIERIRSAGGERMMRVTELGRTMQGRPIPLVIIADPPIETAAQAKAASASGAGGGASGGGASGFRGSGGGRPVIFILANIHAGEIEGKEAALMLIRELALEPGHPLLKSLIFVFAPNYNADGNDLFDSGETNRPGQRGPARVGTRANFRGLDLNRDYIKLEAPESQALVRFLAEWDPHLTIDCHTTNGSAHRYLLTFEAPLNPSGHAAPIELIRRELLPAVSSRLLARTGYDTFFYGNFDRERTVWETYSALPRFGGPYQGLRGQMSVLSEAYSYAPYRDRVLVTREFLREVFGYASENRARIIEVHERARRETIAAGRNPQPGDVVGIRHRIAAFDEPVVVKGYDHPSGGEGGAPVDPHIDHGPPRDFTLTHRGRFEPVLSVSRPWAYLLPPVPGLNAIVENLRRHGLALEPFEGEATVEVYTITGIERATAEFQGHRTALVEARSRVERRTLPAGSLIARTGQPLGTLLVYLLEPQSEDGLAAWNFFDAWLSEGAEFPVLRVPNPAGAP
jgi:hypothetical protein